MPSGRRPSELSKKDIPIDQLHDMAELLEEWLSEYNRYCRARAAEINTIGYRRIEPTMDEVEQMRWELMDAHRSMRRLGEQVKSQWRIVRRNMGRQIGQRKRFD